MLALPKLSIVITVTDGSHRIDGVIREALQALHHASQLDFIVIDDATQESTTRDLARLGQRDARVRVFRQAVPIGRDAALSYAAELAEGEWIVTLDATGRDDPHDIPDMLCDAQQSGLTLVQGVPLAPRCRYRRVGARAAGALGITLEDDGGCGMRLIHREALAELPAVARLHRYLPLLVERGGGRVGSYPVSVRSGRGSVKRDAFRWPARALGDMRDALGMWWFSRRWHPRRPLGNRSTRDYVR